MPVDKTEKKVNNTKKKKHNRNRRKQTTEYHEPYLNWGLSLGPVR